MSYALVPGYDAPSRPDFPTPEPVKCTARVVNLTPHEVTLYAWDGVTVLARYPAVSPSARVTEVPGPVTPSSHRCPVPTRPAPSYGEVIDLPPRSPALSDDEQGLFPQTGPDTYYVVSLLVLEALRRAGSRRDDLLAPSGTDMVRDSSGRILGCKAFVRL